MAGLSLNFIIVVTPWTLKEVVVSCTGTKVIDIYNYMECLFLGHLMTYRVSGFHFSLFESLLCKNWRLQSIS